MNYHLIKYCLQQIHPNYPFSIIDVVTIMTFLSAILFFVLDKYVNSKNNLENYINRLLSLKFELNKNANVISKFIKSNEKELILGNKIVYFRYDLLVTEHIIASGELLDSIILRNLDAILGKERQINLLLDELLRMSDMSHVDSNEIRDLFKRRIISSSNLVISLSNELNNYYPKVINELNFYIEKVKVKKFLNIKNYNIDISEKDIPESFWKDMYLIK